MIRTVLSNAQWERIAPELPGKIGDPGRNGDAGDVLMNLETEIRDSGIVYKCPPVQHDDLGISCAMLAWAARHPHLRVWVETGLVSSRPRVRAGQNVSWKAFT